MKKLPILQKKEKPLFKVELQPTIPEFPDVPKHKVNIRYPLIAPYSYAHIFWDNKSKELIYYVEEPVLNPEEKNILNLLEEGIKELINISYLNVKKGETLIVYLEKNLKVLLNELRIEVSKDSYLKLMYFIYRDFVGLNEVEPLLCDYFIEDIECNGVGLPIYIVHRKYRNVRTNVEFDSTHQLASFVEKLAQKCGQYVSYANPLLDGALPDGSRVNATFTEDISSRGPTFTIRKFTRNPWTPTQLMYLRTASPEILAYLWLLIEYERNIMVIGGTGSGKTTFLNGLIFFIPPSARVVSIEDTRELNLEHSNWLPSVAREGVGLSNILGQKYGEVSLFTLLRESFRQNPDYVIVGEVRGKEAYVLFQGMASGHPSFGTMHANSVDTMIKRLETHPINLSPSLVETMDVVAVMTHAKVKGKEVRRMRELVEVIAVGEKGDSTINKIFVWNPQTDSFMFNGNSHVFKKLTIQHGVSEAELNAELDRRSKLLIKLYQNRIFDFHAVQMVINEYYKDPKAVLAKFGVT
ncbi:MAG: type II/IV secretion system ATPase subunit [Nanoarchaeota archaeon]